MIFSFVYLRQCFKVMHFVMKISASFDHLLPAWVKGIFYITWVVSIVLHLA